MYFGGKREQKRSGNLYGVVFIPKHYINIYKEEVPRIHSRVAQLLLLFNFLCVFQASKVAVRCNTSENKKRI